MTRSTLQSAAALPRHCPLFLFRVTKKEGNATGRRDGPCLQVVSRLRSPCGFTYLLRLPSM